MTADLRIDRIDILLNEPYSPHLRGVVGGDWACLATFRIEKKAESFDAACLRLSFSRGVLPSEFH